MHDYPHKPSATIPLVVLPLALIWVAVLGFVDSAAAEDEAPDPLIACTGRYALCTSAPCIAIPGREIQAGTVPGSTPSPNLSLCTCDVVYGANVAVTACDDRDQGRDLISAYSYAQTGALKLLTCTDATKFTNCLDAPCEVNPNEPSRAHCTCPIVEQTEPWVTFGGDCDQDACSAILWSAATVEDITGANCVLNEYMNLCEPDGSISCDQEECHGPYETCGD